MSHDPHHPAGVREVSRKRITFRIARTDRPVERVTAMDGKGRTLGFARSPRPGAWATLELAEPSDSPVVLHLVAPVVRGR